MDNEIDEIKTPKPARKGIFKEDEVTSPLELALIDTYKFLYGPKGQAERQDVEYAKRIDPYFVSRLYADTLKDLARRRSGKPNSAKNLKAVTQKHWPHDLPSGKNKSYFRFQPDTGNKFKWGAISLIGLPKNISIHRKKSSRLFLAIDYLDVFEGKHDPQDLVGQLEQWTLFTEHAFDRLIQRVPEANISTLREALKLLTELSLESGEKALIEDNRGHSIYVIKSKFGCIYFKGQMRVREGVVFRFYKTMISEHDLKPWQRRSLTRIQATSESWSSEAMSFPGWKKVPIAGTF